MDPNKNDRLLSYSVFLLFVVLLVGSMYYYKERMLFCDAAHIFFETVNKKGLQIQERRYGSFITQLFPLISALLHIPFKTALLLYSMSFNLFYLTVAAILLFRFKNTKLGILFALYFVLFVSDTYYWTNNEIHQAIGWCFLLFGIIQNYRPKNPGHMVIHFSLVILLAFLSLFTHPLMLFIFPFLWLFTILEKDLNPYNKSQVLFLSLAFLAIAGFKYYSMHHGGYDTGKIHNATNFSFLDLWNAFSSPMSKTVADRLIKDYFFVPVLFGLGLVAAILKKKYRQIALVFLFAVSYYLAICLTFQTFNTSYIESELMPFSIIASVLFVYYFGSYLNSRWLSVSLLLIFAIRINFIALSAQRFEVRNNWTFSMVEKMKQQGIMKGYVYINDSLQNVLIANWGIPIESMIASRLMGENPQRTFIADKEEIIRQRKTFIRDSLLAPFSNIAYSYLNRDYFIMDTTVAYKQMKQTPKEKLN